MPRTRNVTRQQWDAAVAADPTAAAIRSSSLHHGRSQRGSSLSVGSSKENYFGYEDADEEAKENQTPPLVRGKSKGKAVAAGERRGRLGRKRPLQDITDTVATRPNLPSHSDDIPRRRRRRVRQILDVTPVSPLSPSPAKRREPQARHIRFPSSLPPSSPPPPLPLSLDQASADPRNPVWKDIIPEDQEDLPIASDDADRRPSSDPFGFFTVERELKAKRTAGPSTQAREAGGVILVPATSPLRLDLSAVLDTDDEEEDSISPCATPLTPHKRKRKRTDEEGKEVLLLSPTTESLPSSPSPLKVRGSWVKEQAIQGHSDFVRSSTGHSDIARDALTGASEKEDEDDGNETVTEMTHRVLRSSTKGKGKQKEEASSVSKRKIRRKARDEDGNKTPSDPIECAQRLINRLPKRRTKVKEEAENKGSKSREKVKTKRTRKPESKKQKGKAPATAKVRREIFVFRCGLAN